MLVGEVPRPAQWSASRRVTKQERTRGRYPGYATTWQVGIQYSFSSAGIEVLDGRPYDTTVGKVGCSYWFPKSRVLGRRCCKEGVRRSGLWRYAFFLITSDEGIGRRLESVESIVHQQLHSGNDPV